MRKRFDEFVDKYLHQGTNETFIDNEAYTNTTKINFTESDYRYKNETVKTIITAYQIIFILIMMISCL